MVKRKVSKNTHLHTDLSNKTVLIVLVAVIVVSMVSLGVYLNAVPITTPGFVASTGATGTVNLEVLGGNSAQSVPIKEAGGTVSLRVLDSQ